jgi:hypothetical protein
MHHAEAPAARRVRLAREERDGLAAACDGLAERLQVKRAGPDPPQIEFFFFWQGLNLRLKVIITLSIF